MEGWRLFRKDRWGKQGGSITLNVGDLLECTELCVGMDEEPESWGATFKWRERTGDIVVGVCYRPPDWED